MRPLRRTAVLGATAAALILTVPVGAAVARGSKKPTKRFGATAEAICTGFFTNYAAAFERDGEAAGNFSQQFAVSDNRDNARLIAQEYNQLRKLVPAPAQRRAFTAYLKVIHGIAPLYSQESAAASQGNRTEYQAIQSKRVKLVARSETLAHQLKLAACAFAAVSRADAAQIEAVVTDLMEKNGPSQCTQEMTPAQVKQQYGSLSACQAQDQGPPNANNATSVSFAGVLGAGAFAEAYVTVTLGNGATHRAEFFMYKQGGHWREMAFEPIS